MEKHHDTGTTDRKIELHCHLDGSLSREFIEKRLGREVHQEELSVSDDCTSLAQYLEKFTLPGQCIMDEKGLEEAGRIDGCTEFGIFRKIMVPLCKPAIVSLFIVKDIFNH